MTKHKALAVVLGLVAAATSAAVARSVGKSVVLLPITLKLPVTDEYHGVKVVDDYRWLESWDDPAVKDWSERQNMYARWRLDALPSVAEIRTRVTELESGTSPDYYALHHSNNRVFALKEQPPKQQPFLVMLYADTDPTKERVVLDPNAMSAKGAIAIDWYVPSLDASKVAVSLSENGSEDGSLHVFDVATGKPIGEVIPGVQYGTGGGSMAWNADGTGFWYTRYPRPGERPEADAHFYQQVYFHKLGTPVAKDTYAIGKEFPRIAEVELETSDDGKWVLAQVANGDGGEFGHWLWSAASKKWTQLTTFADKVVDAKLGPIGAEGLYLLSLSGSPRGKILFVDLKKPLLTAATVAVPESSDAIQSFTVTTKSVVVARLQGGPSTLTRFPLGQGGKGETLVPTLPVSSVGQIVHLSFDKVLFRNESFIDPPAWFRDGGGEGPPTKTPLARTSPADYSDTEVVRAMATSKDGTKVPVNIIRKKGLKASGKAPTVLSGYGGYGVSRTPRFSDLRRIWIEQGGVFAIANLRGGGEFGEDWHLAGNLTKKQNVFDDFAACAELLVKMKITKPAKLAIMGGSNGGLLMGAALTQHPKLAAAVVSFVGIYDMLRVELSPNGEFNVTEFGTVKNPDHFKALHAYSPYHHVVDGTKYPSVLFLTGANDPRVDPMNSRKMAARLQAATKSKKPVLLRTSATSGHGIGTALSEQIEEDVDVYAFLFHELGAKYKPLARKIATPEAIHRDFDANGGPSRSR